MSDLSSTYRSKHGTEFDLVSLDFLENSTLNSYSDFFGANDSTKSVEHLRWLHTANPAGPSVASVATTQAEWAALYVIAMARLRIAGRVHPACQSLDTLTARNFRSHGLFPALAKDVYARGERAGHCGVFGFPNGSSAPIFFQKLGWSEIETVPFLVKPLRPNYFFRRILNRVISSTTTPAHQLAPPTALPLDRYDSQMLQTGATPTRHYDTRADRLWDTIAQDNIVAVERDHAYLNWRLVDKPNVSYSRFEYGGGPSLSAWTAFAAYRKHGGVMGYILELLHEPEAADAGLRLLKGATGVLRAAKCDAILAWCSPHSPNFRTYLRAGFIPLPMFLRPIELHFGVRAFASEQREAFANTGTWYLSYLDSDTV